MHQIRFLLGLRQYPTGGPYSAPLDSLDIIKRPAFKGAGREGKKKKKRKRKEKRRRRKRKKERERIKRKRKNWRKNGEKVKGKIGKKEKRRSKEVEFFHLFNPTLSTVNLFSQHTCGVC